MSVETDLKPEAAGAVTMLLNAGKTIKEIAKFAELDVAAVTQVARNLDLEPATEAQRRGKALYGAAEGLTFQEIAKRLAAEGFTADEDAPMHHLTVASWVRNYGWPWGGAADGDYAPERTAGTPARSRYVLRLSKSMDEQVNSPEAIASAVTHAWSELVEDKTRIVQVAIIRGAALAGVTDLSTIKKELLAAHGEAIRSATW